MVQQSIMETTFVLLGFSGDDPNFEKWTTWVKQNLGEQMPKIYMIGYGQKNRIGYLKSKGITLIDLEELYNQEKNPYTTMFTDLFEFLTYRNREEKTKWPYRNYSRYNLSLEDLKYNREHFPGWIVIPDHIRRANADEIRLIGNEKIRSVNSLNNQQDLDYINELLWCYEHFYIPLEFNIQKQLQKLIDEIDIDEKKDIYKILIFLLNQARFDCDKVEFYKYKGLLEKVELNKIQRNEIIYEEILLNLAFNNIDEVKKKMNVWQVGEKEIEWGIKKSAILLNISNAEEAQEILKGYLQTIRSLLAIQSDDYRLLSLESIALHLLGRINKEQDYGYDRLRSLNLKNCNIIKEFEHMVISIKRYENELGTKETPGFDPGKGQISSKMGDYFKQELLDSYAILNVEELFGITIKDRVQYDLALKNLKILYPLYSLIKRIYCLNLKMVDNIFSRDYVYQLDVYKLEIFIEVLEKSLEQKVCSIINKDVALEIISRIYFALTPKRKIDIDSKIINLMNYEGSLRNKHNIKKVLENLLKRIMFDKSELEQKEFCEKLFDLNFNSQLQEDKILYQHDFFEAFLVIFSEIKDIHNLSVPENKILEMLEHLKVSNDESIRESALIRLTFLAETNSLSEKYREEFVETLKILPKINGQGISEFLFSNVFDRIINVSKDISSNEIESFLAKDIPTFFNYIEEFKGMGYSNSAALTDYFNEIYGVFPDFIGSKTRRLPDNKYYKIWLTKFYAWWDNQEQGLLREIKEDRGFLQIKDYLKTVVFCLKNNILSVAPLELFDNKDIEKLTMIFEKIDRNRSDLSLYLVPSFQRLAIPIKYSLTDIRKSLKSKEQSKVQIALHCIYDCFALIDNEEIELDSKGLKNELFNMLYYCTDDIFKSTIDTLTYSLKNNPRLFTEDDCLLLLEFTNEYLNLIKSGIISFTTLEDFKVISSVSGLVTYLSQNTVINTNENLKDWAEYIKNHRLPEVRKYSDLINFN